MKATGFRFLLFGPKAQVSASPYCITVFLKSISVILYMSQASTLCSPHSAVFRLHQQQSYKLVLLEAGALCKLAPQC